MSLEEAVIEMDIVLTARASLEIDKAVSKVKKAKAEGEGEEPSPTDILKEDEFSPEQLEQIQSTVGDTLGGLDKADIAQFGVIAKNPTGFISGALTKLLGSGGAAILGPLALAIATPIVMAEVIKALSVKGGPFNRDWRRFIEGEVEVGLSRLQQKQKELGISQVILTQVVGFTPNNANWTYNSLFNIDDSRFARIGLSDRAAGVLVQ